MWKQSAFCQEKPKDVYKRQALAYLGFLIIYTYIDIGVFILGFFMGKIIVKRSIDTVSYTHLTWF